MRLNLSVLPRPAESDAGAVRDRGRSLRNSNIVAGICGRMPVGGKSQDGRKTESRHRCAADDERSPRQQGEAAGMSDTDWRLRLGLRIGRRVMLQLVRCVGIAL